MLKTRLIPCLDVADGRVVKGVNFVGLRDAGDPVEAARAYDAAGADEICFLDIHATHENRGTMFDMVRRTAEQCFVPLTVGGGVRTVDDVRKLLLAGADKVSVMTAAVKNPQIVKDMAEKYSNSQINIETNIKGVVRYFYFCYAVAMHNLWLCAKNSVKETPLTVLAVKFILVYFWITTHLVMEEG